MRIDTACNMSFFSIIKQIILAENEFQIGWTIYPKWEHKGKVLGKTFFTKVS